MKRVMLRVAYDGTAYHGWQVQNNARTVEGVLNDVISALTGECIEVIGASRTDAGVHALGNVAVFDTRSPIPGEKFSYALNSRLPEDIIIQESKEVEKTFHPRHHHCRKTYEYTILNRDFPLPEYRNTALFVYGELSVGAMQKAAEYFLGEHDFAAFCSAGAQVKTTVREIYRISVMQAGSRILIRVEGNGFLYNMVRIIAGTLLEVGKGAMTPKQVKEAILSRDRKKAGPTAPAKGLKLMRIDYEDGKPQFQGKK